MLKLAVVGDLSQNDPSRLAQALDAALQAADVVVQVGDINPGYEAIKQRLGTGKLLCVPGNHDIQGPGNWDAGLPSLPKQWAKTIDNVYLVGLNNSCDTFDQEAWDLLNAAPTNLRLFVFCHKPLSPIVFPDGTESQHIMGEGAPCPDAIKLQQWAAGRHATFCHGHYHGWTLMSPNYGTVIVDGRGGAAPQIGYTLFVIQPEGWAAHAVAL
jgi:predicted phosphodiesterase